MHTPSIVNLGAGNQGRQAIHVAATEGGAKMGMADTIGGSNLAAIEGSAVIDRNNRRS